MSFRTRMLLTLTLVLTLSFGVGGTLLIASSFAAALAEEEADARRNYEMVRGMLVVLCEVSDSQDYADLAASLEQMSSQAWAAGRRCSCTASCTAKRILYSAAAEAPSFWAAKCLPLPTK